MLLQEDGHLDIERVKQLNEEQLDEEMESWGPMQLCEWEGYGNFITLEEFGEKYHRIIRELWHEDEEDEKWLNE